MRLIESACSANQREQNERNEKDRGGVEWRKEDTKERRWNYLHLCPGCRRGRRVYKSGTIGFGAIDFVIYDIQASEKD